MNKSKEKFKNDRALRFYSEVLGLEKLHYGIWEDSDERNFEGIRKAQQRYEDFLIDKIEEVFPLTNQTRILDVGCGTGAMSENLFKKGYKVEGLSPDLYQKEEFEKRTPVKFHLARFQNFQPEHPYEIVLMSESAQYIPLSKLFDKVKQCLQSKGYLMVCDYFTYNSATGPLAKSGHNLEAFLELAKNSGFKIIKQEDITQKTIPTLDAAKIFTDKYVLPAISIASEKFQEKKPFLFKSVRWIFRKKIAKAYDNITLLDSSEFAKNKCYMFFLFQVAQP